METFKTVTLIVDGDTTTKSLLDLLSQRGIENILLQKMSHELVIDKLHKGKLHGIDPQLKLFTTVFYNCFVEHNEVIVQVAPDVVTLFFNPID